MPPESGNGGNGGDTSLRVSTELADELWGRKERGDSYEDVIWRLIELADRADDAADQLTSDRADAEADADPSDQQDRGAVDPRGEARPGDPAPGDHSPDVDPRGEAAERDRTLPSMEVDPAGEARPGPAGPDPDNGPLEAAITRAEEEAVADREEAPSGLDMAREAVLRADQSQEEPHALPGPVDPEAAAGAVQAVVKHLRDDGAASRREIVMAVMPDYPLRYDPPEELEEGERFRGAWWRRVVVPSLRCHPAVEYRRGYGDYKYVGEE